MTRRLVFRRLALVSAAALLALATSTGCGGGGGGGGTPTEPQPQPGIVFTPGLVSGSGISLSATEVTTTSITLEVRANSVQDLYGVAFDFSFPSAALRFDGAARGTFLGNEGNTTFVTAQPSAGNLVVGLSRLGAVSGVSGSGALLTLRFTAVASGSGTFAFSRNSAVASTGAAITGLSWAGGTIQVTQR